MTDPIAQEVVKAHVVTALGRLEGIAPRGVRFVRITKWGKVHATEGKLTMCGQAIAAERKVRGTDGLCTICKKALRAREVAILREREKRREARSGS